MILMSWGVWILRYSLDRKSGHSFSESKHEIFAGHMDDLPHFRFTEYMLEACDLS